MKYFSLMCMAAALSAPAWAAPLMAEPETLRAEYCRSKTEPCSKVSVTRAKFKQTAYTHFADDVLKSRLYLTDLIHIGHHRPMAALQAADVVLPLAVFAERGRRLIKAAGADVEIIFLCPHRFIFGTRFDW